MNVNGVSTLASMELRQRQTADLQTRLERVGAELTTGQRQDIANSLGAQTEMFESLTRAREAVDSLLDRNALAANRLDAAQLTLESATAPLDRLAEDVLAALGRDDEVSLSLHLEAASAAFAQSIGTLNTHQGGRYLFAGAEVDRVPLAASASFTQEVGTAAAGAPDITGKLAAIDALFDTGLPASLYAGDDAVPEADIALGERATIGATANDASIRPLLQGLAMLAALDSGEVSLSGADRDAYIAHATEKLEVGIGGVTQLRAALGFSQERIANADTVHQANRSAMDLQIDGLVGVDPYEAATEFQALESQLQASYLVTSRLAGLSLTNFLR